MTHSKTDQGGTRMTGLPVHSPGLRLSEGFRDQTKDQPRTQETRKTGKGQKGKKNGIIADGTRERGKEEDPKLRASRVRDDLDPSASAGHAGGQRHHGNPGHRDRTPETGPSRRSSARSSKKPNSTSWHDNHSYLTLCLFTSGKIVGSLSKALNSKRNISAH